MVCEQPVVAELPAEEVADEKDCDLRRSACHVSLIGGGRERDGMTSRLAVPFESSNATFGDRHRKYVVRCMAGKPNVPGNLLGIRSSGC